MPAPKTKRCSLRPSSCPGDGGGWGPCNRFGSDSAPASRKKICVASGACDFLLCLFWLGWNLLLCPRGSIAKEASEEEWPPFRDGLFFPSLFPTRTGRGTAQSPARPAAGPQSKCPTTRSGPRSWRGGRRRPPWPWRCRPQRWPAGCSTRCRAPGWRRPPSRCPSFGSSAPPAPSGCGTW